MEKQESLEHHLREESRDLLVLQDNQGLRVLVVKLVLLVPEENQDLQV